MTPHLTSVAAVLGALLLAGACGSSPEPAEAQQQDTALEQPVESPSEPAASPSEEDVAERYADARRRTDIPVTGTADVALPAPVAAPRPPAEEPAAALGPLIELPPPSALADPPGPGRVLVSTIEGQVFAVDLGSGEKDVVMDLRDRVTFGGEQGLLGMAIDPQGDRVYLDYTALDGDTEIRSWALDDTGVPVDDGAGVLHLTLGQPDDTHNAGNLVFGPDDALWIATGDGGGVGDPADVAQDDRSLLGKMLRVWPDPAGGVRTLASNPDWARPEIWGVGLRNPWRWSFDSATNQLWVGDVGQNRIEEVSVVAADEPRPDFGWDSVEGHLPFEGERSDAFVQPEVTYGRDDGCSIVGGHVYRGEQNPDLYGWYLFADFCNGWIRAVPSDDPSREPVEVIDEISSVISLGELEGGELVALTVSGIQPIVAPAGGAPRPPA